MTPNDLRLQAAVGGHKRRDRLISNRIAVGFPPTRDHGRSSAWRPRRDSNPRPPDYKSDALPAELHGQARAALCPERAARRNACVRPSRFGRFRVENCRIVAGTSCLFDRPDFYFGWREQVSARPQRRGPGFAAPPRLGGQPGPHLGGVEFSSAGGAYDGDNLKHANDHQRARGPLEPLRGHAADLQRPRRRQHLAQLRRLGTNQFRLFDPERDPGGSVRQRHDPLGRLHRGLDHPLPFVSYSASGRVPSFWPP